MKIIFSLLITCLSLMAEQVRFHVATIVTNGPTSPQSVIIANGNSNSVMVGIFDASTTNNFRRITNTNPFLSPIGQSISPTNKYDVFPMGLLRVVRIPPNQQLNFPFTKPLKKGLVIRSSTNNLGITLQ